MYPNPVSLRALFLTVIVVFVCTIPTYAVPSQTPKLLVKSPERYSIDPLRLTVEGALPGGLVVINATLVDDEERTWSSRAVFYADAQGHVDVSRALIRRQTSLMIFNSLRRFDRTLALVTRSRSKRDEDYG